VYEDDSLLGYSAVQSASTRLPDAMPHKDDILKFNYVADLIGGQTNVQLKVLVILRTSRVHYTANALFKQILANAFTCYLPM
jgi:hypothetical protein